MRWIARLVFKSLMVLCLALAMALAMLVITEYFDLRIVPEAGGALAAAAQRQPPPQTVGQMEELLRSLDLTGEVASTKGRPLRMRKITVQPGGALALHNHVDRPAVTYMLQGEMTYYVEGRPPVVVRAGEGMAEGRATTHWAENTGKVPAVWIGVDIPNP
jgi:quercetin dioxygenase-like cupin family protein